MRTARVFFYLLLCCEATEGLSKTRVTLGQNVTLDCSLDNKDICWFFLKPSDSLVVILRTFTTESTYPMYNDQKLKTKYFLLTYSRLFISNITTDELGIYYCAKPALNLQISNGTKLYTTEPARQNQTEQNDGAQHMQQNQTITHSVLTVTSISLNILLFITILGLLMLQHKKPREKPNPGQSVEADQSEDLSVAEYSEIELSTYTREAEPSQINGLYALLQKPKLNATRSQTRSSEL